MIDGGQLPNEREEQRVRFSGDVGERASVQGRAGCCVCPFFLSPSWVSAMSHALEASFSLFCCDSLSSRLSGGLSQSYLGNPVVRARMAESPIPRAFQRFALVFGSSQDWFCLEVVTVMNSPTV